MRTSSPLAPTRADKIVRQKSSITRSKEIPSLRAYQMIRIPHAINPRARMDPKAYTVNLPS